MDIMVWISGGIALGSFLGALSATFYSVRLKTIITTLQDSNAAYKERNEQLDLENNRLRTETTKEISELKGRVKTLESIKTPPMDKIMQKMDDNHTEVMLSLNPNAKRGSKP